MGPHNEICFSFSIPIPEGIFPSFALTIFFQKGIDLKKRWNGPHKNANNPFV